MGSHEHTLIYPLNNGNEYNLVSILAYKAINCEIEDFKNKSNEFLHFYKEKILDWDNNLQSIIQNSNETLFRPILKIKKLNFWHKNNLVLLGDAAHSISPHYAQGAAQSIESAYELCKNLCNFDLTYALKSYEKIRKKRVENVEKRSNFNNFLFQINNVFLKFIRNLVFKLLLRNKFFLKVYFNKLIYLKK